MTFHPLNKLDVGVSSNYTNNLLGSLYQNILTSGGVIAQNTPGTTSSSIDVNGFGSYKLTQHIFTLGNIDYRQQSYRAAASPVRPVAGSVTYWHPMMGGTFSSVVGVNHSPPNPAPRASTGFLALANYSRRFGPWTVNGSGNYSQNTQTALIGYTTSGFGYNGSISRKLGRYTANVSGGGSNSLS